MAPSSRVMAAFKAMENIGISKHKTKPALKKLLKLFDKNWDLIEEENYRVLADTIFEYEDSEAAEKEKNVPADIDLGDVLVEEAPTQDEPDRPLKRLRKKYQDQDVPCNGQPSPSPSSSAFVLKIPKPEPGEPEVPSTGNIRTEAPVRDKGKRPISPTPNAASRNNRGSGQRASQVLQINEPKPTGVSHTAKQKQSSIIALIQPKDEPFTDDIVSLEGRTVAPPEFSHQKPPSELGNAVDKQDGKGPGNSKYVNGIDNHVETVAPLTTEVNHFKESVVSEISPTQIDIAASPLGEVKILLSYNHGLKGHDFHVPDVQVILKKVEENCVKTYKVMNPEFSLTKVMTDVCESALLFGTNGEHITQEKPNLERAIVIANRETLGFALPVNGSINAENSDNVVYPADNDVNGGSNPATVSSCQQIYPKPDRSDSDNHSVERDSNIVADGNTKSLVTVDQHFSPDDMRRAYDMNDITRGKEEVKVSLEKSNSEFSPSFHYISQNVVSHNANVMFSLAQIGDGDNCSCLGDCSSLYCNCLQRNRGECPYTSNGVVREEFLDECISIVRNPQKHDLVYCKECPLETSKNEDMMDPCKGHLKRKFIKECWTKCGCSKNCGNQVVQQGIRCNLQVFWTSEGKGWGLKTLGELPKGAFVCEYVGEILTNTELHERNVSRSNDKHSYSVLLDADWGSKALKEDELLCLDATFYGNVARFINHRCTDANLIEIPVEVETPNHHYYHIALFTTRKVAAFEELTWDYGIHFDDSEHHIKAFNCLCGSNFCQNMKRSSRSRSALL